MNKMSEQEQEIIVDDEEVLETPEISEDEDLLEFKSDDQQSEVPDSTASKTDEKKKGKGDAMPKLNTKAGMLNAAMEKMGKMKKDELSATYKMVMSGMHKEEVETEDEVIEDQAPRELASISIDDIDVSDDVNALLSGSELDEEFKEKATTIFEAAVVSKVNEQLKKFAIEVESDAEVTRTEVTDELTEKVDSYLDYVVQEWMEENKLAIEQGVRADMVEDFLKGLKGLFEEHYVDIPEEKVDVVEELISKVDELEDRLNEQTDKNVELSSQVKEFEKDLVFSGSTEDLTDTQIEKLRGLAEGIDFTSAEDFSDKIKMLKKQYFEIDEETDTVINDDEKDPISLDSEEEKESPTGAMANYMAAISRSAKN
jgi:hypothetical protein